jgi:serine/threonine protein kinase/Tol biopolymer transport system component
MTLPVGTRLGSYEILAPLGAGGMGEVYRARDARLDREVAVKLLPAALAGDPDRLARFEREAKAVAALSHPNILAIHDFGSDGASSYAVTELLTGQTLRERLEEGPLTVSKAVALAIQVANGLAAAHDKGIVHRDLKPDNVMILPGDHVKILDFGLVKLTPGSGAAAGGAGEAGTMTQGTEAGVVLGTMGYMSPEQVRGLPVDARSDIFSLGALVYEMLSGRRAFRGDSSADTMSAVLREEPSDLAGEVRDLPLGLERILRRCLEKRPEGRFRSAHDLALALEAISTVSRVESGAAGPAPAALLPRPRFKRLTFRNGSISSARFADGDRSVVYGAAWEGGPFEIYSSRPESPESRNLGLPPGDVHAVSVSGEMALSLGHRHTYWFEASGTLARASLGGGGVRLLLEGVACADWSPDGRSLAVVRSVEGRYRIEYPAGTTLYETDGWISHIRVSRDGSRIAFGEHPFGGDTMGSVCMIDRGGRHTVLVQRLTGVWGVCWSPDGDEVWFSGISERLETGIWGASPGSEPRPLYISPSRLRLHDVTPAGRMLVTTEALRLGANVGRLDSHDETDLAWFDASLTNDLSRDGRQLLFTEVADAENPHYAVYLRSVDGSAAVRLGEGVGSAISPDGAWVLAVPQFSGVELALYPTGLGVSRLIRSPEVERFEWAGWEPDGKGIVFLGTTGNRPRRLYRQSLSGGSPELLLDEEIALDWVTGLPFSPDGKRILIRRRDGSAATFHTETRSCDPLTCVRPDETAVRFDRDGQHLFVARVLETPPRIERLDIATGGRTLWRELRPGDSAGVVFVGGVVVAPEAECYAYTYLRSRSDLYLVEGIR